MLSLLPPEIASPGFAALLVCASFFTSALTAAVGVGGGLALLAVMGAGLPVSSLIPAHGLVQLGSNAGRALVLRRHLDAGFLRLFLPGAAAGAAIGGALVVALPETLLKLTLAGFVLALVWGPKPQAGRGAAGPLGAALGGAATTALTMFLGATGPLVAALIAVRGLRREVVVGTMAAAMTGQHLLKTLVFGVAGFPWAAWAPLLGAMIASGFLGTLLGRRLLGLIPESRFRAGFRWLLSALAVNLALQAIYAGAP